MLKVFSKGLMCIWSYRYYGSPHKTYTFKSDRIVARKKEVGKSTTQTILKKAFGVDTCWERAKQFSWTEWHGCIKHTLSSVDLMLKNSWWTQNERHVLLCILLLWVGVMSFCFVLFLFYFLYFMKEKEYKAVLVGRRGDEDDLWGLGQKERIW